MRRRKMSREDKSKFMEDFFYKAETMCNYINAKYYDNASDDEIEKLYKLMKDRIGNFNDIVFVYKFSENGIRKYVGLANMVTYRSPSNITSHRLVNPLFDAHDTISRALVYVHCYLYFDSEKNRFSFFNYNELKRIGLPKDEFEIRSNKLWSVQNNDILIANKIYVKQKEIIRTRTAIIEEAKVVAETMRNILKDNEETNGIKGEA